MKNYIQRPLIKSKPFTEGRTSKARTEAPVDEAMIITAAEKKMLDKVSKGLGAATKGVAVNQFATANQGKVEKAMALVAKAQAAVDKLADSRVG